jgi:hypothetical protein
MNLQERIELAVSLGQYMLSPDPAWEAAKEKAGSQNSWFIPEFVDLAVSNIARSFLQRPALEAWVQSYDLPPVQDRPKKIGIVMAGNIPLVGFHDLLCVFIAGHIAIVKPSSKDDVLIRHLAEKLSEWSTAATDLIRFPERLKGCDAYIATGSNNSAGYFDYYFGRYPHIIRRNRTSAAVLDGSETREDLDRLADDVFLFFGLGCRNVTKIYVPQGYDFIPLLDAFKKYDRLADHHKYKNNYDYNLAIHLLNRQFYMSTSGILLVEDESFFSPISQLNYSFYNDHGMLSASLKDREELQCIVGKGLTALGEAQGPSIAQYADGVDTLRFLISLS